MLFHEEMLLFSRWQKTVESMKICRRVISQSNVFGYVTCEEKRRIIVNVCVRGGLPAGTYCNIIDDCKTSLQVGTDSRAQVYLKNHDDPILAVCIGCDGDSATPFPIGKQILISCVRIFSK